MLRRRQSPVKSGRRALPACVLKDIGRKVDALASQHHVSRSWVIAVILADALNISEQQSYLDIKRKR